MISNRRSRLWLVGSLVGVLGGAAMSGVSFAQPGAVGASRSPEAGGPRKGPPRGPGSLLTVALRELSLTDAQKTTIRAALELSRPSPGAGLALFSILAAGVRAGQIDQDAVVASEGEGEAQLRSAQAAALKTLHDTLSRAQRSSLVSTVMLRAQQEGGSAPPSDASPAGGGPLDKALDGLGLSDAQRASIDQALAANRPALPDAATLEAIKVELQSRLATFASDSFDATTFVAPPTAAGAPRGHASRLAHDLSAILPELSDAQREQLATQLESGPQAPPARSPSRRERGIAMRTGSFGAGGDRP